MAGLETVSGTLTASDTATYVSLNATVPGFVNGYIWNAGGTTATIYLNSTSADETSKAQVIPAGTIFNWEKLLSGPIQSFRYKTASGTTTLYYHFYN